MVEAFKKNVNTNFLIENKFKQTILHMVLKAGYYNKIAVHGDESGGHSIKTLECLFEDDSSVVQKLMRGIVNRLDHQGNSALHYAKPYPDQSVAKLLLRHGAKLERNEQKAINVLPRTLEEHFYEFCINTEGEDVDDEEFKIRINFKLFEKPFGEETGDLHVAMAKANAWAMEMEEGQMNKGHKKKNKEPEEKRTGKVDTKRLEHFSDVDSLHYLLKHPVMTSFLEMELKSLKFRYWLDVILYFGFVVVLFLTLSSKYGLSHKTTSLAEHRLYSNDSLDFHLTIPLLILISFLALLIIRELWQLCKLRKRYFETAENYIEWTVIVLVVANILPGSYVKVRYQTLRVFSYPSDNTSSSRTWVGARCSATWPRSLSSSRSCSFTCFWCVLCPTPPSLSTSTCSPPFSRPILSSCCPTWPSSSRLPTASTSYSAQSLQQMAPSRTSEIKCLVPFHSPSSKPW